MDHLTFGFGGTDATLITCKFSLLPVKLIRYVNEFVSCLRVTFRNEYLPTCNFP